MSIRRLPSTTACFVLLLALLLASPALTQPIAQENATPLTPQLAALVDKLASAATLLESKRLLLPAVFVAAPRRAENQQLLKGADGFNGTVQITRALLLDRMDEVLYVYGLPKAEPGEMGTGKLVGQLLVRDDQIQEMPLAAITLDPSILKRGALNVFHVFNKDLGDELLGGTPTPDDYALLAEHYVGTFTSSARITDAALNDLVGALPSDEVEHKCWWSIFCTGFPVGGCDCYWSKVERQYVCGKPRSIATASCVGWCSG